MTSEDIKHQLIIIIGFGEQVFLLCATGTPFTQSLRSRQPHQTHQQQVRPDEDEGGG